MTTSTSPTGGLPASLWTRSRFPPNVDYRRCDQGHEESLLVLLRQLEWAVRQAKSPLFETSRALSLRWERDVIKRT